MNPNQLNLLRQGYYDERIKNVNNFNIKNIVYQQQSIINNYLRQQSLIKNQATQNKLNKINEISAFFMDLYNDLNEFKEKLNNIQIENSSIKTIPLNTNVSMNINNNDEDDLGNIDPYKLYGFEDKKYTFEQLKEKFRTYALQTHPDKNNGNSKNFNIIKNAFKFLHDELKKKEIDKNYLELKNNSRDFINNQPKRRNTKFDDNFNLNQFNKIYDDNKLEDENNYGYETWMKDNNYTDENIIKNKNINKGNFNRLFDENVKVSKEIINYEDPKTLFMNEENNVFELGKKVDNFTGKTKNIAFTDYKEAHSNSRLVNNNAKFKTYNSINDIKNERSNIRELTHEELMNIEIRKQEEEEAEMKRVQNLQYQDKRHFNHYNKLNKLMLNR